ncbi:hypothetical protein D3C76_1872310 [compost metagenome]
MTAAGLVRTAGLATAYGGAGGEDLGAAVDGETGAAQVFQGCLLLAWRSVGQVVRRDTTARGGLQKVHRAG